jgi:4-amino-4-deoxy-L-arabinose transferase-like glycosyltransferase
MRLDRERAPLFLALLLTLVALLLAVWLHRFFLQAPAAVGFDDGYTVAVAERMIDGRWLPYVDGVSHRGPLLYWVVALTDVLGGRFSWGAMRALMLVCSLATIVGLAGAAIVQKRPLAAGFGALLYVFTVLTGIDPSAAFGITGEAIAATFGALALFATAGGLASDRPRLQLGSCLGAGILIALAGLTKQTALPLVLPLGLWIFACGRRSLLQAFGLGFFVPLAITLARYAFAGELGTFWYWFYGYNAAVYMSPYERVPAAYTFDAYLRNQSWQFLFIALSVGAGVTRWVAAVKSWDRGRGLIPAYAARGFDVTTSLFVLVAFIAVAAPRRFWPSYFPLVLPFASLGLALEIGYALERAAHRRLASSLVLGALFSLWVGYVSHLRVRDLNEQRAHGQWPRAQPDPICETFQQYSEDRDPVFIWGFDADWYVTCRRTPATRFTYLTPVAGIVPPFWTEVVPSRVATGSRQTLLSDLERNPPLVVLDSPDALRGASLSVVPELDAYVRQNYCNRGKVESKNGRHAAVWVRRDRCP